MTNDLQRLMKSIEQCNVCIERPLGMPLPHPPRPVVQLSSTARLCIAGQAPGLRVHNSGVPFDDPSGDRLRDWMGVDRTEFYDASRLAIIPMGFCFPGYDDKKSDLPPRKECATTWREQVFAQMPQLELVLVIGQYAQAYHLKGARKKTLTETVANWRETFYQDRRPRYLVLPHPSWRNSGWIRRNPWFSDEVLPVLKREARHLMRK
jgi:uracil-DNA glycosylase